MTSLLVIIFLYIYAVIGFFFFKDMFYNWEINKYDSDSVGESMCQDMLNCFTSILDKVSLAHSPSRVCGTVAVSEMLSFLRASLTTHKATLLDWLLRSRFTSL